MKEYPILFNTDMVRAILADKKTQTRRPIELGPYSPGYYAMYKLPYKAGDLLWVKETWGVGCRPDPLSGWVDGIEYKADAFEDEELPLYVIDPPEGINLEDYSSNGWRPSIHMPRWACRLFLEVDEVGIQRLQDISGEDAKAEGMESIAAFIKTWDAIYEARGKGWEANPWCLFTKFHVARIKG